MIRKWIYKLRYFLILLSALLGLLGVGWAFWFVNWELIQAVWGNWGGGYTYLILDNNESWNFDWTWVNRWTENLVEFTNNWNWNWDFMYNADYYTNIWRLNSNNAWYYYWLQTYYFFSNNKLYFHKAWLANWSTVEVNSFKLFEWTWGLADYSNFGDNNSTYTYSLSDVVSQIWNVDSIIYGVYTWDRQWVFNYSRNIICFGNNNVYYCSSCVPWDYQVNPFCLWDNNSIVNLWLDVNSTISDIAPLVSDSPFVWGGGFPDIVWSWSNSLTNWDVIVWLSYRYWFSENSCYWGYPIDNLFVSWTDPKDFTWFLMWTWASIFDIYNSFSWSYFTWIVNFYDSFYSRYKIWNLASFWDYPKGLYSIVERADLLSQVYNLYPMNMSSLVEYCNLYLNSDWDSLYTWNNIVWQQGYNSLIGEITDKWRYYDTDLFSWSDMSWSVSIDEFFETISNRLVGWLQDVADNRVWVIPSYILMVMMALILFRLISH